MSPSRPLSVHSHHRSSCPESLRNKKTASPAATRSRPAHSAWSYAILGAFVVLGNSACSQLAEKILPAEEQHVLEHDLDIVRGDFAAFRRCFAKRGGTCPEGASSALPHSSQHRAASAAEPASNVSQHLDQTIAALSDRHPAVSAHEVLRHPVSHSAAALHDHLRGHQPMSNRVTSEQDEQGRQRVSLDLRLGEIHDFFESLLSTVGVGAWDSLHEQCRQLLSGPSVADESQVRLEADCRRIAYVRGYLGAYFRNGHFIEVDVQHPQHDSSNAASPARGGQRKASNVVQVSDVGFLSRDGSFRANIPTLDIVIDPGKRPFVSLDSPGLKSAVTPTTPGSTEANGDASVGVGARLGAQVIRVYFEALFDAADGLPAVAASNLGDTRPTGLELGSYSLPLFRSPLGDVDAEDLTTMTRFNNAVSFQTQVLVGRIISGLGPLNLNNPPIENAITEIVATTVRKVAEKASWCWYACDLDVATKRLADDSQEAADQVVQSDLKKLAGRFDGSNSSEDRPASDAVTMHVRIHP